MDHAATTPVDQRVFEAMKPYLLDFYSNASSLYQFAQQSKKAVDEARLTIARLLEVSPKEIYFTSGGTEANNWAIQKIALKNKNRGNHLITSTIEHHSVLETFHYLENNGFDVTYIDVDQQGIIDLDQLKESIRDDTTFISIMTANNELGTIQPIDQIGQIIQDREIYFHTDAVQAIGKLELKINEQQIDLLSGSAHKFNGPKGTGFLYIKKGTVIESLLFGGAQERGLRAGTENVAGIVGMAKAMAINHDEKDEKNKKIQENKKYMVNRLQNEFKNVIINGDIERQLPGTINIGVKNISSESLLMNFDMAGICVSSGSACASGSQKRSHVIQALGIDSAYGIIRISLGKDNTKEEIDLVMNQLKAIVERLS
jgi:cysteine desulfurase